MKRGWWVVLLGVLVSSWGQAWGIDGPEVLRKQKEKFDKLTSISARFEKRHYWKLMDQTAEIRGRLYVQKPDRFRLETDIQTVATDGKTAWNYSPKNRQVVVSSYKTVEDDRSYEKLLFDLILLGGYQARFTARYVDEERVDGHACYLVELTARQEDSYISHIRLWVDRKLWLVRRVEYRNINDDVTTYVLSDFKVNKIDAKEASSLFVFTPPAGVDVVDLR